MSIAVYDRNANYNVRYSETGKTVHLKCCAEPENHQTPWLCSFEPVRPHFLWKVTLFPVHWPLHKDAMGWFFPLQLHQLYASVRLLPLKESWP